MQEEKDPTIKITDRRRYNPDGSLREGFEEEEDAKPEVQPEARAEAPVAAEDGETSADKTAADNVVSFPGAINKPAPDEERKEDPQPKPAAKAAAASAVSAQAASAQQQAAAQQAAQAAAIENAYNQASAAGGAHAQLPQASFMALLNMLAVEAAMHLGLMETEPGVRTPVDLDAARHMVDMIGMLREKTRGNLTPEEENVTEQVLADLRMQYVTLARRK